MSNNNKWWGYLHSNGTVQVKRWYGDTKDYTDDCDGNPFVHAVCEPLDAISREEAIDIITKHLLPKSI